MALLMPSARMAGNVAPMMMQFPPFHIEEADYKSGVIEVTAKSPSGKSVPLKIGKDANGQFTTNFVPNEIGDWLISITSNKRQIKGSPFTVRVYDGSKVRVYGIEGGENGLPVKFTVDTARAGNGKLKIEITKDGQAIIPTIDQRNKQYYVTFKTKGPGIYLISVFYAAVEVPGSPFKVAIVDSSNVTASGEGLVSCMVGRSTSFIVNTTRATMINGEVTMKITSPSGVPVETIAIPEGAGIYKITYLPVEIGKYGIEVNYGGKAISGSPFVANIFGLDQVTVTNWSKEVAVNKTAILEFDANDVGDGEPVVRVDGGKVPCELKKLDRRKYRVSFVPRKPGKYLVDVQFYDEDIPGSPFKVKAFDGSTVSTTIGSVRGIVRNPVKFEVNTAPRKGDLKVQVYNPTKKLIQSKVFKVDDTLYNVEFLPMETGNFEVIITFEDLQVDGSPFVIPVANPGGVLITMKSRSIILGQAFHMTADTTKAGPGDLTVRASSQIGPVPIEGTLVGNGLYTVTFTPDAPGQYYLDVSFDCKPLPESPIMVTVHDIRNVIVSAGNSPLCKVGQSRAIHVSTNQAGCAELQAKLTPHGQHPVPLTITGTNQTGFDISFVPKSPGPHKIDLTFGGVPVPDSPIVFMCYDASKIKVMGVSDGVVGKKSTFLIDLNDSGEGELEVVVRSTSGKPVVNEVVALQPGRLEVSYVPMEGGSHHADVTFNKETVPGGPFVFKVHDPNKIYLRGDGIENVQVNQSSLFYIMANEAHASDFDVAIRGPPNSRQVVPIVTESGNNQVKVEYIPKTVGEYQVNVAYQGVPIPNSPFHVKVWDASRVLLSRVGLGYVGVESTFNVEMKDAGDGTVEISIIDPTGQLLPNHVLSRCPGVLQVSYTPVVAGTHNILVDFNSVKVKGTPMQFQVVDLCKVSVKGEGIGIVPCNIPTSFLLTAPDAKLKDFDVIITDPNGQELIANVVERGNAFKVDYTPIVPGPHTIDVCCFGAAVKGNPFVARAYDVSRVSVTGLRMAQVGEKSHFDVLVAEAGEGVCEISITDPNGQLVPNQVTNDMGILSVAFVPTVNGVHRGTVLFNKQNVPGSPFTFLVIDKNKVSCRGLTTGIVPVGKLTNVTITAPSAEQKDVDIRVVGPQESEIPSIVHDLGSNNFKVDFTPMIAGEYNVVTKYFGQPVWNCGVKAWDPSKVLVGAIPLGRVSHENSFNVDVREAGEGKLEISIKNPSGQMIGNKVSSVTRTPGLYQVTCVPLVSGAHNVNVMFNGEHADGSPFTMNICDPKQVSVVGEGLHFVRCNKVTNFEITGPAALIEDVHVSIKSPSKKEVKSRITSIGNGKFLVEYTPREPGEHLVNVKYFDEPVKDSPFTVIAWNPAQVLVNCIAPGVVGRPSSFHVNAVDAGPGNLEVMITCQGELVKNTARTIPNTGLVEVTYVPICLQPHVINVKYNGENIPGSPFTAMILNGNLARASGQGLGRIRAGIPTKFNVLAKAVGAAADLEVMLTSPSGQYVPTTMTGSYETGFTVEYLPLEPGQHILSVQYAGTEIKDSPFHPDVFDPCRVMVSSMPVGCINKNVSFKIDASCAGPGKTTVCVQGHKTRPFVDLSTDDNGISLVNFVPTEGVVHNVIVKFNDVDVQGSPFKCAVVDQKNIRILWDAVSMKQVGKPVNLQVDTTSSHELPMSCTVLDPSGNEIPAIQQMVGPRYSLQFVPEVIGNYMINILYGCDPVPGSPFTCSTFDPNFVRILEVTPGGNIGQNINFSVDTKDAGLGPVDATVTCEGVNVPLRYEKQLDLHRFAFVARSPFDHVINVFFNKVPVPGTPFAYQIINPANNLTVVSGNGNMPVGIGQTVLAYITPPPGVPISVGDCDANVLGPFEDNVIPCRLTPLSNGNVKVEYSTSSCGPHALSVNYAGQMVPGCPIVTEIFDPNKIVLEGLPTGEVSKPMTIYISKNGAGSADLQVSITGPHSREVPFELDRFGETITYIPDEAGIYRIDVIYGGLNVPGCPIRQEIKSYLPATASGDGLFRGVVGKPASFFVDPKGQKGELVVQVQGPTGLVDLAVEKQANGTYRYSYIPPQAGIYDVSMVFNGKEVPGNFRPKICDPSQVIILDTWECWTQEDHVTVHLNKLQSIMFDTSKAGPGELTATIETPDTETKISPDIIAREGGYLLKFIPKYFGNYVIRVYFNECPIPVFPIIATCSPEEVDVVIDLPPMANTCSIPSKLRPGTPVYNMGIEPETVNHVWAEPPKSVTFGEAGLIDKPNQEWIYPPFPMPVMAPVPLCEECGGTLPGFPQLQPAIIEEEYRFEDAEITKPSHPPYPYEVDASKFKSNVCHPMPARLPRLCCCADKKETTTSSAQTLPIDSMATQTDPEPEEFMEFIPLMPPFPAMMEEDVQFNIDPIVHQCPAPDLHPDIVPIFLSPTEETKTTSTSSVQTVPEQSTGGTQTEPEANENSCSEQLPPIFILPPPNPPTLFHEDVQFEAEAFPQPIFIQQVPPPVQPLPPPFQPLPTPMQPKITKVDETMVVISGPGLSVARCKEQACFVIDGKNAGPGQPAVRMMGLKEEVRVDIEQIDDKLYGCSYVASLPGAYLLSIWWDDRQIPNSPIKITVLPCCDPKQVVLHADCLKQAQVCQDTSIVVDCRRAGNGTLAAYCQGPSKLYPCEIDNRNDGTYEIIMKLQEIGNYILNVTYDEEQVPGSPISFKVGASPDAGKVRVSGDGLKNGILATFDSRFVVDTRGAGPGQLNVKVRGKKGTFQVEMKRDPKQERVVLCKFNPTEIGEYYVIILWAGEQVPGSPFKVIIVDTLQELNALQSSSASQMPSSGLYYGSMNGDPGTNFVFED